MRTYRFEFDVVVNVSTHLTVVVYKCAESEEDAQDKAWAEVLLFHPTAICRSYTIAGSY